MRLLSLALLSLALISPALAGDQIVRPWQSIRSAGMGGSRITTGRYDENFFGNPALVTENPHWRVQIFDFMFESTFATLTAAKDLMGSGDTLKKISNTSGKNLHGRIQTSFPSFYFPGSRYSVAFGLLMSTQFDVNLRRNYQADTLAITDIGPAFTIGRKFLRDQNLSVGITPHLTYRLASKDGFSLVDLVKGQSPSPAKSGGDGTHLELDIGGHYKFVNAKRLGLDLATGASINNIFGGTYGNVPFNILKNNDNRPRRQPRSFNFGASATRPQIGPFKKVVFSLEFTDIGNNKYGSLFRLIHIGNEWHWLGFSPRFGINQGYLTAGLGIDLLLVQLDFATYGEEMSLNAGGLEDRRYAFRLAVQL